MKRLKVFISDKVRHQIDEQVLFIAHDSIDNALKWEARLRAAFNGLATVHGHSIDEEACRRIGGSVRKLVFEKTYLVFYEVNEVEGRIEVINLRHGARLPKAGEP